MGRGRRTAIATSQGDSSGRFAYDKLDRVFHEKARLGIMTSLISQPDGLTFPDLRHLCALSDGNLNRHLAVLQEAGFVEVEKEGGGRLSRTVCRISRAGKVAFTEYLGELERVLADAATAKRQIESSVKARPRLSSS